MPVRMLNGELEIYKLVLDPQYFPRLLQENEDYVDAVEIEIQAVELAKNQFPAERTIQFVRNVCMWGNVQFIYAGIVNKNPEDDIVRAVQEACAQLQNNQIGPALNTLWALRGLGVSFASKHLRMLAPNKAVVLDSIISARVGYPLDAEGYEEFIKDCANILEVVQNRNIPHPYHDLVGDWRLCDIEMVIYSILQNH